MDRFWNSIVDMGPNRLHHMFLVNDLTLAIAIGRETFAGTLLGKLRRSITVRTIFIRTHLNVLICILYRSCFIDMQICYGRAYTLLLVHVPQLEHYIVGTIDGLFPPSMCLCIKVAPNFTSV